MTLRIACFSLWICLMNSTTELQSAEKPKQWRGTFPVAELKQLPNDCRTKRIGAIRDEKTYAKVWQALKLKVAMPEVDFNTECVIFAKNVKFFNPISILKLTQSQNTITVIAAEGRSARPIKDRLVMSLTIAPADANTVVKDASDPK